MNTQETILKRRSVRAFTKERVTDSDLSAILKAAYVAPVAGNAHKVMRLTVVRDAETIANIGALYQRESGMKVDPLYGATTLIIVSGHKDFERDALFVNAGCILENIQLSATEFGLGSVINWATKMILPNNRDLTRELGINDDFIPLAGIAIGYSAKETSERRTTPYFETNFIGEAIQ